MDGGLLNKAVEGAGGMEMQHPLELELWRKVSQRRNPVLEWVLKDE